MKLSLICESSLVDCPKCDGVGFIEKFDHVQGGRCFKCGGNRWIRGTSSRSTYDVHRLQIAANHERSFCNLGSVILIWDTQIKKSGIFISDCDTLDVDDAREWYKQLVNELDATKLEPSKISPEGVFRIRKICRG